MAGAPFLGLLAAIEISPFTFHLSRIVLRWLCSFHLRKSEACPAVVRRQPNEGGSFIGVQAPTETLPGGRPLACCTSNFRYTSFLFHCTILLGSFLVCAMVSAENAEDSVNSISQWLRHQAHPLDSVIAGTGFTDLEFLDEKIEAAVKKPGRSPRRSCLNRFSAPNPEYNKIWSRVRERALGGDLMKV